MNNNTFSTNSTIINDHYMLFPYNEHHNYSSQSVNDILIHSSSNTSNNHDDLDYHHQFLQPSPFFSQFESLPDSPLFASFLPQNNGHGPNDIHHQSPRLPSFIGDQPLEPLDHFQDSQKISASLDPKMKKIKKPSRTDRHSKIKTAKGTRDRRMRLSVDVARELFGLQDMLGFDKASKTVEWLLTQAKPEIIKIAKSLPHHCGFCSGDESQTRSMNTTSDIGEFASMWTADDRSSNIDMAETKGNKVDVRSMKGKTKRLQKRTPILTKLSKDARAKARERAKYRTKEKMMKKISQVKIVQEEANDHDHDDIIMNRKTDVNWNSFETTLCEKDQIEERCNYYRFADCSEFVMNKKHHIPDESYDTINNLNSSFPMLNHHRNPEPATSIEQQQQHRFADLHHFLEKPRSLIYNYQNMC